MLKAKRVRLVLRGCKANKVKPVLRDRKVKPVFRERKVKLVAMVLQDKLVLKAKEVDRV